MNITEIQFLSLHCTIFRLLYLRVYKKIHRVVIDQDHHTILKHDIWSDMYQVLFIELTILQIPIKFHQILI